MLYGCSHGYRPLAVTIESIAGILEITGFIGIGVNTRQHRVLAAELIISIVSGGGDTVHIDMGQLIDLHNQHLSRNALRETNRGAAGNIGRGFGIAPAEIDAHKRMLHSLIIGHDLVAARFIRIVTVGYGRIEPRHVIRDPDMPAPHDPVILITYGNDGVTLSDRCFRHLERQTASVVLEGDIRHQILLILPYQHGIERAAIRIVVDIGIRDRGIEVIDKAAQYVRPARSRSVGRRVGLPVLDGIAVDQRQGVDARGIDNVAIRSVLDVGSACRICEVVRQISRCRVDRGRYGQQHIVRIGTDGLPLTGN